jgi:DNA mismatch endonuclease Vsr
MRPEVRRRAMRSNRGRTRPERALARGLWHRGLRYVTSDGYKRRFGKRLAGTPDLVFLGSRTAVFLDGCFWHGCVECARIPEASAWTTKIARNRIRDSAVREALTVEGWRVMRIPEHAVRTKARLAATVESVAEAIVGRPA